MKTLSFLKIFYSASFFLVFFSFFHINPVIALTATETIPRTPTILIPNEWMITTDPKPLIQGVSESGNTVKIYFDDVFNGFTIATADESGIGSFAFRPSDHLSYGVHTVKTVAVNDLGKGSRFSRTITFRIEPRFVTPRLTDITHTNTPQPTFTGIAANDSLIQIFIDDRLDGEFYVTNHFSGTTSFTYQPFLPLRSSRHSIYFIAKNREGKSSNPSPITTFDLNTAQKTSGLLSKISKPIVYAIQTGDTLWGLSKRYYGEGSQYARIVELNKNVFPSLLTTPNLVRIGWELIIR
ncbi:MAG: hypothetical protein A3B74_03450 [Candidatus Kerfeldbacteria bacterium RIFCSPHIGHO2_02_FULL_42_14]|uniref:LysM domain-containing protein n=1 Tax=Candidatus Kerfeldbacteria bacterium RIFCSPHIGHO2_02_FULL_42_14 TaxID=1798540 RepID=A0A1G2ASB8_9BACT|nr:MAG: hypothetical protein A3B74_03450 [Candidatus Kerfeldbacteria bacterium RIFCSPHIGHO2_02_FULL_42_14]OGY82067.1 MAG: hypothetical protein A3E60_00200 [Candidatus Kerfeldbacteria bacterium RIFCSPHIGHO2_12_FULL_42_13]OGY84456.1 MAG: hypothetical protein A3I91_00045 [Candidatus Kerfeldbacteria bacterium RIFCSPLOWO2_02_FULL_42_19]OGY86444.1 MAG: hypothetical protein A3G01_00100 [Candidatus Kerfeldbacteria bacterium RIFCSPLOWO2_12_FULL_43_9]